MNKKIFVGAITFILGILIGYVFASIYPINIGEPKVEYKQAYRTAEVPATWSTAFLGDAAPAVYDDFLQIAGVGIIPHIEIERVGHSIAQGNISFGDLNWSQIDMAYADGSDLRRVVQELKSQPDQGGGVWTVETIDDKHADVLTFPLDENGQVSKGGTGGKVYFVTWEDQGLYMWKQALGDEAFEKGFVHFLETLDLDY